MLNSVKSLRQASRLGWKIQSSFGASFYLSTSAVDVIFESIIIFGSVLTRRVKNYMTRYALDFLRSVKIQWLPTERYKG